MSKSLTPFLIVFVFCFFGCARNNMPSDHQMLENFNLHEPEFEKLRKISVKYDRFHYPSRDETDSIVCIISSKDKKGTELFNPETRYHLVYSMMEHLRFAYSFIHGEFLSVEDTRSMSIRQSLRII